MNMSRRGIAVCAMVLTSAVMMDAQTGQRGRSSTPPGREGAPAARGASPAGPVVVFETAKGNFEIEMFPAEAPKSVEHILALVKRNFYNGQRVHRIVPGQLVQFGDPLSRDMTKREFWGTGGSNRAIGVAETSPKHRHLPGAVSMAHPGDPKQADSQMFIMIGAQPKYDGGFTVFGQVSSGMDVVRKLAVNDIIRRVRVKS